MANPFGSAPFVVTQPFGRTDFDPDHKGVDLVARPDNAPIYPIMPGVVFAAGWDPTGNYVIVQSPGYFHAYWHLSGIYCTAGQKVTTGTFIARQGGTGRGVSGTHLHLELRKADRWGGSLLATGTPIDPLPFIHDQARGGADDMDPQEVVRGLYRALDPHAQVSGDTIKAHAERIARDGRIDGVMQDILSSRGWLDAESHNVEALTDYYNAAGVADPRQTAIDRVLGGQTWRDVAAIDVPYLMSRSAAPQDPQQAAYAEIGKITHEWLKTALKEPNNG